MSDRVTRGIKIEIPESEHDELQNERIVSVEEEILHEEEESPRKRRRRRSPISQAVSHPFRKFSSKWLNIDEVKDWIAPYHDDQSYVWCKYCRKKIRAHLSDMKVHNKTMKHQRNVKTQPPEVPDESRIEINHTIGEVVLSFPPPPKIFSSSRIVVKNDDADESTTFQPSDGKEALNPANIGFIGCGNMAQALLNAFISKGLIDPNHVIASAPSDRNLSKVRPMGIKTTNDNNRVVQESDIVFLCVKPHLLTPMLEGLDPLERNHNPLFVSIITGFSLSSLEEMLSTIEERPRVIRTMPNTPCMVGQGCCVYALGSHASLPDGSIINSMLSAIGVCAQVPEEQIDAVCGLAGSGPAYIYAAIEALADGGVKMGLPRQLAQQLAAQTVKGAACMVMDTEKHPAQLKDEVCSPGGTTITAMHSLERNGFRHALIAAVEASATRSRELGNK